MKRIVLLIVLVLVIPSVSFAQMDIDLRFKLGMAAGLDEMNVDPFLNATGSADDSRNVQLELAFVPLSQHMISPVFTVGFFDRRHSGTVSDYFVDLPDTSIDYDVTGISVGAGARFMVTNNFGFEGRIEAGAGEGKPTLSTPGLLWNSVKEDGYVSWSFIIGSYYTFPMPRIQLGIEIGVQSFSGNFQILNNDGYWSDADVDGTSGIANVSVGYRF